MSDYRRVYVPGGTYFFTVVTNFRRPFLTTPIAGRALRESIMSVRRRWPFRLDAIVLLPDHLHCIWVLPDGDDDYSTRWRLIKSDFTTRFLRSGGRETGRSRSRFRHAERGVWHRRFWEHRVRNEAEYEGLCDYIHYNPVKHGVAGCPHEWPYSTFGRFVRDRYYRGDWLCMCGGRRVERPQFRSLEDSVGE